MIESIDGSRIISSQITKQRVPWHDIESAPKDGTEILCCNHKGTIKVCRWDDINMNGDKGWQWACVIADWNYYEELDNVTYWMPLPEADWVVK
jgi:hypothetical protein